MDDNIFLSFDILGSSYLKRDFHLHLWYESYNFLSNISPRIINVTQRESLYLIVWVRDPRTGWFAFQSVRVGPVFYWSWYVAVRVSEIFAVLVRCLASNGSGAWIFSFIN